MIRIREEAGGSGSPFFRMTGMPVFRGESPHRRNAVLGVECYTGSLNVGMALWREIWYK